MFEDFKLWLNSYSPRTQKTYTELVQKFLLWVKKDPQSITIMDINAYQLFLKNKVKDITIAYSLIALRRFFYYLYSRRAIKWDWEIIKIPKFVAKSHRPATTEETQRILDMSVRTFKDLRNKTIISFLYSSALRVSELCDLLASDIDTSKQFTVIVSKKNRQKRMVFWNQETNDLLKQYLPQRGERAESEFLFISLDRKNYGKKLSTRSVQRFVRCRATSCQIQGITPHSFRHGLGVRSVQSGLNPRYTQLILGHKNINSSQIYMQIADPDVKRAYETICG